MVIVDPPLADITSSSLTRFVRQAQKLAGVAGQVDVLITGNRQVRELNRRFRKHDKSTDVLSFPGANGEGGDIAIAAPIAVRNAARYRHAASDELKVLILHGLLHLAGYDHERDHGRMAAKENRLRARLRLPSALIQRSNGKGGKSRKT
ncbi:MAG TPA: rRNA maturation RNase YbeY [Candidatus Angelobacter sp.]